MPNGLSWESFKRHGMPRRVGRSVNHLEYYGRIFGRLTPKHQHGERIEIEINHEPWNQLSIVKVYLPLSAIRQREGRLELLKISRFGAGSETRLPVEITDVKLGAGLERLETMRDSGASAVFVVLDPTIKNDGALQFEFVAWEVVGPMHGHSPYLVATLDIVIELGVNVEELPAVVLLKTPRSVTPRSTQGNFALAYPSRTTDEHRVLGLYFAQQRLLVIKYTAGATEDLLKPWEALARSSVSAALVILVTSSSTTAVSDNRFLALLAAFVAAAQVSWEAAREIAALSIYGGHQRAIPIAILGTNIVLLSTFIATLLVLSGVASLSLEPIRLTLSAVAFVTAIGAVAGVLANWAGSLHGYTCDFLGCKSSLGLSRRRRVECRYTGRVFCNEHIDSVCAQCVHGPDLIGDGLGTSAKYSAESTICVTCGAAPHLMNKPASTS